MSLSVLLLVRPWRTCLVAAPYFTLNLIPTLILTQSLTKAYAKNPNPNEIFDQFPNMDISRDQDSFSPISGHAQGAILPDVMWVIRNQRSKIHRLELVSTVRTPSRKILKIDCRVI